MWKLTNRVFSKLNCSKCKSSYSTQAEFTVNPFKLHKLETGPSDTVTVTRDDAVKLLRQMQLIRRMETMAGNLYKEKLIRGFCHLYSGQEACAVGMYAAMRSNDCVISAYRVHGWTLLMGAEEKAVLSELVGKRSGVSKGKGGSMHMYGKNFYGGNGIVGAQVPLGAGIAFACKYKQNGGVCLTLYGDGASNQGQVFEAYNMAKLWSLPCIFVCENNGYGMGTSAARSSSNTDYYTRGDYIPGIQVDGMDVLAVREATKFAIEHCTNDKGPMLLETVTYRYSGHSMSDPGSSYRKREEIQRMRETKDPITIFKSKLLKTNIITEEDIKNMEREIKTVVEAAANHAKEDVEIPVEELAADVYAKCEQDQIRGTTSWKTWQHKNLSKPINLN